MRSLLPTSIAIGIAMAALGGSGCDSLNARRDVREGNESFKQGRYEEAVKSYEEAVKLEPTLVIAHHNLALAYSKLIPEEDDADKARALADKSAEHFGIYLKQNPGDNDIRQKMTQIWLDAGEFPRAIEYWEAEHKLEPTNREVVGVLASINYKAGNWEKAVEWLETSAKMATNDAGKIAAYRQIGNVAWGRLSNREKTVGAERIKIADFGISALQRAAELDKKSPDIHALLASIYSFRALAQGPMWAASIDRASAQDHSAMRSVLAEEAKKAVAPAPPAASGSGG